MFRRSWFSAPHIRSFIHETRKVSPESGTLDVDDFDFAFLPSLFLSRERFDFPAEVEEERINMLEFSYLHKSPVFFSFRKTFE
jgi:hypothetical protein